MANLMPAWTLVRVYGTWAHPDPGAADDADWVRSAGTYTVTYPGRITNVDDDAIWTGGVYETGTLSILEGEESLDIMIPATDDPSIEQVGFKATLSIFVNGKTETYVIDVPIAARPVESGGTGAGVNLRTIALAANIGPAVALYGVGTPGGLAKLSSDGLSVVDKDGNPIAGGEGGVAGVASYNGRIGAVVGNKGDVGLANADNTSDANKPISTATQAALNLKAPIASPTFTGTPAGPTASAGTETTQLATTAFVAAAVDAIPTGGVSAWGDLTGTLADQLDLKALTDTLARHVFVTTGSETRPAGAFCIWYDQRAEAETPPTNIGADDLWITTGGAGSGGGGSDVTAPSVPTGLASSSITATSFSVSWTASTDDVGVTGYRVLIDGVSYATPSGTSQTVTGRTAETAYDVTVQARDAAGNWSTESSVLEVTTTSEAAETYSIFASPPDTASTSVTESNDGTSSQWVGDGFYRTGAPLTITGVRLWVPPSSTFVAAATSVAFRVYVNDWAGSAVLPTGTPVATGTYSGPITPGEWVEADLSAPVTVAAANSGATGNDVLWVVYQVGTGAPYVHGTAASISAVGGPNSTYMAERDFRCHVLSTNGGTTWDYSGGSSPLWWGTDIKATL
jgi:chitodextrinase